MSVIHEVYRSRTRRPPAGRRWLQLAVLALLVIVSLRWAVWNAVFVSSDGNSCRAAAGACWAVITSQWRLALFGTYPSASIWRPALASVVLMAAFAIPALRPGLRVLTGSWAAGIAIAVALLNGELFGLASVESSNWGGLPLTLLLSEGVMLLAFPLGLVTALARCGRSLVLRSLALVAVECVRGVPLVSLLFFATLILPLFFSGLSTLSKVTAATAAIVLFDAAYISEVIRGGLMSVPRAQFEAADALGLRWAAMHRLVVLPQALKACAPSLVNQAVGIVKDTSLVAVIGLFDFMNAAKSTLIDLRWRGNFVEVYVLIGLTYFVICTAVAFLGQRLSARLDLASPDRQP